MASSTHIHIGPDNTGFWQLRQSAETANTVSALLNDDLKEHHVFFNNEGFHNHITHQLLSLYGTGAPAGVLQDAYDANKSYQRHAKAPHSPVTAPAPGKPSEQQHPDWYETKAPAYLGREAYYPDFLRFFQQEIDAAAATDKDRNNGGWPTVVTRRLLAGTPAADDLLVRLFAGFLHPLIQLQYGLEWQQPAIVAQGLAQAAVHKPQGLDAVLFDMEKAAAADRTPGDDRPTSTTTTTIRSLYQQVADTPALAQAARAGDANKMRDGVLARARDEMVAVAARVHVPPTDAGVAAATAEMAEACLYAAASAALHPQKHPKFDFFLIHHVNSIPFFLALNAFDWVPVATKARLLEWKIRMDLVQYAARACPPLREPAELARYTSPASGVAPARAAEAEATTSTQGISPAAAAAAARLFHFEDDGHAIKLVRATGLIERLVRSPPHATAPWRILRGADGTGDNREGEDAVWAALYTLETDAVRGPGNTWVRTAGLEEAWENVQDEPGYEL